MKGNYYTDYYLVLPPDDFKSPVFSMQTYNMCPSVISLLEAYLSPFRLLTLFDFIHKSVALKFFNFLFWFISTDGH